MKLSSSRESVSLLSNSGELHHGSYFIRDRYRLDFQNAASALATFTGPQVSLLKCVSLISRFAMKETPSVAEIVFLLGEQWESRCLNVGMSELRVKAIILPHVAQHGREISKEKAGSCSPLGVTGSCDETAPHSPGYMQPVPAPAGLVGQCLGFCDVPQTPVPGRSWKETDPFWTPRRSWR
ncbi:hypothetical protein mRhiFer1_010145 [Rhinolophus ferrumequinum]|uniref:Uncharacterized protein n=1 Tax=Rhinolophus ferrumequinum TaxID=59479 RepID=A0A7J7XPK6_RHIFE|nr:hypothetical protein mRhiFer1_010145 [Rhinolophus ferrumequinum]